MIKINKKIALFDKPKDILEVIMIKRKYRLKEIKKEGNIITKTYMKGRRYWKISYPDNYIGQI